MNFIKPIKTTNRTKAQIVVEKELELYSHLIYNPEKFAEISKRHIEHCPCGECADMIIKGILNSMKKNEKDEVTETFEIERFVDDRV